jgi:hypothetical protein
MDSETNHFYSSLATPFLFIILYKTFDVICITTQSRHIYLATRYSIKPHEKLKPIDFIGFVIIITIPLLAPLYLH